MKTEFVALEKFMKVFGITYDINYVSSDYDYLGKKYVCFVTEVYYENQITYCVFDCYYIFKDGSIRFMESNIIKNIDEGIFIHFSDKKTVEEYFKEKVKDKVRKWNN